jgi:hypothetical protein
VTPELAAERAAEVLEEARKSGIDERVVALVQVADGWTRLHTALANAPKPEPDEPAEPDRALVLNFSTDPARPSIVHIYGVDYEVRGWHFDDLDDSDALLRLNLLRKP